MRIKNFIWLVPAIYTFGAFILSIIVFIIDLNFSSKMPDFYSAVFLVGLELAETILGTIAGSLLTMTTITFSTIMVVLTTYSSQFSPRTLQNFIRDPITMRVLGIFIGGFVYAIFSLLFLREGSVGNHVASATFGVLIAFICLAFFAYFIHHVATSVQVSKLIERLAKDLLDTIEEIRDKVEKNNNISLLKVTPMEPLNLPDISEVKSEKFGYIQLVDTDILYKQACDQGITIEVKKCIGQFVSEKKTLAVIHHDGDYKNSFLQAITIGKERTTMQDVEFGLQKIAEIALRAISPGINDPNTAIECIRYLGVGLSEASKLDGSYLVYYNDENEVKVILEQKPFNEILHTSLHQIVHYGRSDVSVMGAILDALFDAAEDNNEEIKKQILHFSEYTAEKIDKDSLTEMDLEYLLEKKKKLAELIFKS
ncbi:DUF2254 domain-containing protein [Bacillus sp. ISL-47]|uniref:DUF2254 domain-containing protein n=1 Tax=Bacillus sp. ISL-47 TaxID=2819130 RepID=UPI001BE5B9A5|nr:DUF2254 domain-containing protein [Bacillus sp. ISL-47]MBT2687679.1 DUF2254 domain-containing protein [Bacillus sp. ISL-47]MBT2707446.1 DUF2254 domain-containing protein [Pseudomonas sp. ISL-84]